MRSRSISPAGRLCLVGELLRARGTERLGIEETGGVVRAGLAHYNTREEVDYCLACLREIA